MKGMEFRIEEEDISVERLSATKKKWVVMGIFIVFVLSGIFVADGWQQRRFATVKSGYEYMKTEQYSEAVIAFEDYLDVNLSAYWFLVECVNDESYSRQGVSYALQECKNRQRLIIESVKNTTNEANQKLIE